MTNKNKITNRWLPVVLCLMFFAAPLFANTAAIEIETLLQTNAVTYGQAARFILEAADIAAITDTEEAFNYLSEKNWVSEKNTADQIARLDVISGIFMKAFDIKGGLFYSLTEHSHYAYRELVYKNVIQGMTEPSMKVSGELLLFMTNRILSTNQTGAAQ